jgi:hypothetical protein
LDPLACTHLRLAIGRSSILVRLLVWAGLGSLAACGGEAALSSDADAASNDASAPSSSMVTGSVAGLSFELSATRAQNTGATPVGIYPSIRIELLELPPGASATCAELDVGRALRIYLFNERDQTAIGPGTYLTPPRDGGGADGTIFAGFFWHHFLDASEKEGGGTGSVTLDDVSATTIRGSFDATLEPNFGEAGHLSGTFTAPVCP